MEALWLGKTRPQSTNLFNINGPTKCVCLGVSFSWDSEASTNSPGHNQICICNFLQSDWLRAKPKYWLDRERTKLDRNVEQGNFEANSCRVLWVECTLKKSNSNTEPINRDYFMRHSVRFTNIEMLMIENAFCKHPWISDNILRDQARREYKNRIHSLMHESRVCHTYFHIFRHLNHLRNKSLWNDWTDIIHKATPFKEKLVDEKLAVVFAKQIH